MLGQVSGMASFITIKNIFNKIKAVIFPFSQVTCPAQFLVISCRHCFCLAVHNVMWLSEDIVFYSRGLSAGIFLSCTMSCGEVQEVFCPAQCHVVGCRRCPVLHRSCCVQGAGAYCGVSWAVSWQVSGNTNPMNMATGS